MASLQGAGEIGRKSKAATPPATAPWTLRGLVAELAARGREPAVITLAGESVERHAAADIADQAQRLAAGLRAAGLRPGEAVGLFGPNGVEWIVVRLALGLAGALSVAVDDLADETAALDLLRDSGCARVFVAPHHRALVARLAAERPLTLHLLAGEAEEGVAPWHELLAPAAGELPAIAPEAPCALFETSGTTGRSKRFTLSEANIGANVAPLVGEGLIGAADRVLLPLPLHHVYPLVIGLFTTLGAGAALVLPESTRGPDLLRAIQRAEVTAIVGVPRLYAALVAALEGQIAARGRLPAAVLRRLMGLCAGARRRWSLDPGRALFAPVRRRLGPRLRLLVSGGAKLEPEVLWKLVALGWEVRSGYGLAETASTMTGNLPGRERLGTEGRPFQGGELRIAEAAEPGDGEIQMRGPNVFAGYLDEQETREAFTEDGWFRTGDLGRLDAEGYLTVTGRLKEVLVLGGGKKVMPERLEKLYGDSPYFEEVAVLERQGSLVALVRPNEAAMRAAGNTRVEDVVRVSLSEVGGMLPSYERLAGFALVREPLPRTRLGKYRRFLLPELYEAAKSGAARRAPGEPTAEDRALLAQPLGGRLWAYLQARYAGRVQGLDDSLALDLGIDSLEQVTLSLEMQNRFGLEIDDERLAEATTVRELIAAALEAQPARARRRGPDLGVLEPAGGVARAVAVLLYGLNRLFMRGFFRLRVEGAEHLPREAGFVLVANHVSDLDPPILGATLPLALMRRTYWGGVAQRLFDSPLKRRISRALNIFPVDERRPGETLALAAAVLDKGRSLIWFPESWRSPDGRLQRFLPGIGKLLQDRDALPVVPAYIDGAFDAMPRDRRLPRPVRVTVRFGPPAAVATLLEEGAGETPAERIADALHARVARLANEDA